MNLKEYLYQDTNEKRILIVNDVSRANTLLRYYEKNNSVVSNVTCRTLNDVVQEIFIAAVVEKDEMDLEWINQDSAEILFRRIVLDLSQKQTKFFTNKNILNRATVNEILENVNLIRSNGLKKEVEGTRLLDLVLFQNEFEKALKNERKVDDILAYQYVLDYLSENHSFSQILHAKISVLKEDTEQMSGLEKCLIEALVKQEVVFFDNEPDLMSVIHQNVKNSASFFEAYGSYNEANFVAYDILKKEHSFGETTVYYTSDLQIPFLKAALEGNGIESSFVSSYPIAENQYIQVISDLIAWMEDDYSQKMLMELLSNSVIQSVYEAEDENKKLQKRNAFAGENSLKLINQANAGIHEDSFVLGWGYERNCELVRFYENHLQYLSEQEQKKVNAWISFYYAILDIFGNGKEEKTTVSTRSLLISMIQVLKKYTKKSKEQTIAVHALQELIDSLAQENTTLSLKDACLEVKTLIDSCTTSDTERSNAVRVQKLNDWKVLDRPYVYFTGMSLSELQPSVTESSILLDSEMEEYLEIGYVPTARNRMEQPLKIITRTLSTLQEGTITFGYSSYDTVAFCQQNPSSIYNEIINAYDNKEIQSFEYGINELPVIPKHAQAFSSKTFTRRSNGEMIVGSPTRIESLLACPRSFALQRVHYIPQDNEVEKDTQNWLDSAHFGTFFHNVSEKYVKAQWIGKKLEDFSETVDNELLDQLIEEEKEIMLKQYPFFSMNVVNNHVEKIREYLFAYFEQLHQEFSDRESENYGWKPLVVEQEYENAKYIIPAKDDESIGNCIEDRTILYKGFIDRVDYRMDSDTKEIQLRVIDYKTGKKESKVKSYHCGHLIQPLLYENALMSEPLHSSMLDEIKKYESDTNIEDYEVTFKEFRYDFPKQILDNRESGKNESSYFSISAFHSSLPEVYRLYLIAQELYEKGRYMTKEELVQKVLEDTFETDFSMSPDEIHVSAQTELLRGIYNEITLTIKDEELKDCDYCSFRQFCHKDGEEK